MPSYSAPKVVFVITPVHQAADERISRRSKTWGRGGAPRFRSSFWDWAAECSDAPREVCELALAHVNTDRVGVPYRRSDLFERRRTLMEARSAFLAK